MMRPEKAVFFRKARLPALVRAALNSEKNWLGGGLWPVMYLQQ